MREANVLRHASLVSEGLNGIQIGRFVGGISAKDNSHDGTDEKTKNDPIDRDDGSQFEIPGGGVAAENAEKDTEGAADFAEDNRLENELSHDVALFSADGAADSDLASALGDRDQHDVHNAD